MIKYTKHNQPSKGLTNLGWHVLVLVMSSVTV